MSYIKNADIQGNAWVAPGACVVGNVTLGDESSVWYNAVIRGDMAPIVVGCGSKCTGWHSCSRRCRLSMRDWQRNNNRPQCDHSWLYDRP